MDHIKKSVWTVDFHIGLPHCGWTSILWLDSVRVLEIMKNLKFKIKSIASKKKAFALFYSLHARNEIEGVFACNSKYVVCFKKLFAGKGGLYEFIMFYDMRA